MPAEVTREDVVRHVEHQARGEEEPPLDDPLEIGVAPVCVETDLSVPTQALEGPVQLLEPPLHDLPLQDHVSIRSRSTRRCLRRRGAVSR